MGREIGKLTALKVAALAKRGKRGLYGDGGGLWLQIRDGRQPKSIEAQRENGARPSVSWVFIWKVSGSKRPGKKPGTWLWRQRTMGLGPLHTVSLGDAREQASRCRRMLLDGVDPLDAKGTAIERAKLEAAKAISFKLCAEKYIEAHKAGWRNAKHQDQWANTLATYAYPVFGDRMVQSIDLELVMQVLKPIWHTKPETASRLRGRIERILDWAKVSGYREGENPARWKGWLQSKLPSKTKVRRAKHHPALPYAEIGAFLASLRVQEGIAARALEFTILTAARTSETIGAGREEFNPDRTAWTVPDGRIKGGKEHRVPLSLAASAIVKKMLADHSGAFAFPGGKPKKPLSNAGMSAVLDRMGRDDITVHGFRSTFRDWAADNGYPRDIAEMALAHVIESKVEAAYRRGDLFERRRPLMEAWAEYCAQPAPATGDKVVQIRSGARQKG